jgi:hypothetical protein
MKLFDRHFKGIVIFVRILLHVATEKQSELSDCVAKVETSGCSASRIKRGNTIGLTHVDTAARPPPNYAEGVTDV